MALCSSLRRGNAEAGTSLFPPVTDVRMHGSGTKLPQGRLRLVVKKHFFMVRVAKHWDRLPGEMLDAPWLSVLKRHLDNALINML